MEATRAMITETKTSLERLGNVGIVPCPVCKGLMQHLCNVHEKPKPELYCGVCHMSIPLFEGRTVLN